MTNHQFRDRGRAHAARAGLGGLLALILMMAGATSVMANTPPLPADFAGNSNLKASAPGVSPGSMWTDLGDAAASKNISLGYREDLPRSFRLLQLDLPAMTAKLAGAPHEKDTAAGDGLVVTLPMPDGSFQRFRLLESPVISPEVQAVVPEFRSYSAQGIDDPSAYLRLNTSQLGFHAYGRTAAGHLWIDPYSLGDTEHVISSWVRDFDAPPEGIECGVAGVDEEVSRMVEKALPTSGDQLHTFRLVLTLTGEYTNFFGGPIPATAQAVSDFNSLIALFEVEAAIRFNIIAVNAYVDPATDPFTNGNGMSAALLIENQITTDAVFGAGNYDLGHLLTTIPSGFSGLGYYGGLCSSVKAQGGSAMASPVGNPYVLRLVAHEMGHQLDARHTYNSGTTNCGSNRVPTDAFEPGSGSTIMSYAGVCGGENMQPSSDPYFHVRALERITAARDGAACAVITPTGNTPPVAYAGPDWTIPRGTAFWVTGSGTDPDANTLSYCWEQYDLGAASPPVDPYGPLFRSLSPMDNGARYFPDFNQILDGSSDPYEIMPSVDRTLTLRMTVRDNALGGGGIDDDELVLTVAGDPFAVTAPNGGESFVAGQPVTVTWDVGGSIASDVVIWMLSSAGFTSLANPTANDGSEAVIMPCGITASDCRIWIEEIRSEYYGVHVFDVSNTVFSLSEGLPDLAPLHNGGYGDKVVVNGVSSPALPTNLFGDSTAYMHWAYLNFGTGYGCGDFGFRAMMDERSVYSPSFPNPPSPGNGTAWGPAQVIVPGGRHTAWLEVDPNNLLAESNEANNGYARQWVWLPAGLTNEGTMIRSAPPERLAGSQFIPGGVTFYENTDGLRITAPGSTWRAAAISAFDGSDYDLKLFEASTGVENGFTSALASSGAIGLTDIVLINEQVAPPGSTYDLGITLYGGTGNYIADNRHSGAPISLGTSLTGVPVGNLQVIDIGAFDIGPTQVGRNVVEIDNVSALQEVTLLLFDPGTGLAGRFGAVAQATTGSTGRAFIDFDMTTPGTWAYVLVREASNGVDPFTYDVRVRPTPPDIATAVLPGSHGPVVPRNDLTIPTGDPVPAPTILNGDAGGSWWYFHVANNGPANADLWDIHTFQDGVNLSGPEWPFGLPGGTAAITSNAIGTQFVTGGRHTAGLFFDALDEFDELNEDNNRYAEQWVWNPTQLMPGQTVTRATPPDPLGGWDDIPVGLTRELNVDGLRTPAFATDGDNGYWGGFAMTPGDPADIDLRVHAASTGAQDGFDVLLETSNQANNQTEIVLFDLDESLPGGTAYDIGMERVAGDAGYTAHATESLFLSDFTPLGQTFGTLTLGAGEIMGLFEFGTNDGTGVDVPVSIILENDAGGADLGLAVFGRTDPTGFYTLVEALPDGLADDNGFGQGERVDLILPADGFFGIVVYKTNGTETGKSADYRLRFFDPALSAVGDAPALVARIDNYPNPFNPQTSIDFTLERAGRAEVRIYDVHGKLVRTLEDGQLAAGKHTRIWQGRDNGGRQVASGVYMARFVHPDGVSMRRMVLLK